MTPAPTGEGVPLKGDRAARDTHNYADYHASDIEETEHTVHVPLPGAAGGLVRSNGSYWVRVDELPLADLAAYARGSIIRGGAADWEALDAKTARQVLIGDGTDVVSRLLQIADLPDPLGVPTASSILTIASGAVTATQTWHAIAAESGTEDDLDTITAAADRTLLLLQADTGDTITVKHGTGNISLNGAADFDLSGNKALLLYWTGSAWVDLGAGGGGGGGDVATDSIWDAKGDLAAGTGSDAAVRVPVGTNGQFLQADSTEAAGVKWDDGTPGTDSNAIHDNVAGEIHAIASKATPVDADELVIEDSEDTWTKKRVPLSALPGGAGGGSTIQTVAASAQDAHTVNDTWETVGSMEITVTPTESVDILCWFSAEMKYDSTNWEYWWMRFVLDAGEAGEVALPQISRRTNTNANTNHYWPVNMHGVFEDVAAGTHTITVEWKSASQLNVSFYERRLSTLY